MRRRGFTLIELMVVMAVIAVLLTIAVPRYFSHVERSKEAVLRQNLNQMREAIDKFHADKGKYPAALGELVERRYLRALPVDPVTDSDATWVLVPPPAASGLTGVYDVRSGADGLASSGQRFGDL